MSHQLWVSFRAFKGDAVALGSTFIIWTCLFGMIFLKEKLHRIDMLMIPVTIGGVILIARPPFIFGGHEYDENTLAGIFYSLLSAISIAGIYIFLRKIGNEVHYTIASFYYSLIGFALLGITIWSTTGFHLICTVNYPRCPEFRLWTGQPWSILIWILDWITICAVAWCKWSICNGLTAARTSARKSWSGRNFG